MSMEEHFLEEIEEEDEEDEVPPPTHWRDRRHKRFQRKNQATIDEFLGKGSHIYVTGILPRYYGELLTWALHQYLKREKWETSSTLGYHVPDPVYTDVNTGDETENLLVNGQLLVQRDDDRYIVTVDVNPRWRGSVQLEGLAEKKEEMGKFITGILTIAEEENLYRGRKIEFSGRIRFLDVKNKSWDSIVLDTETKTEIKANTLSFLKRSKQWSEYGIPQKRGILLAGEPGTGKTVICKALMAEAEGVTCITTNGYALDDDDYIIELYELAEDISPSIVFIEDIDLIGQNRMEFGYQRGSALLSLLAVLDGVEEQNEIVTIATTNCLEILDKALSQRPSRFDRVIKLTHPSLEQRGELVNRLCLKIPLDAEVQRYIAMKADGCTPAQLQEIIFSLVIQCPVEQPELTFDKATIDRAISRINNKNRHRLGFGSDKHNGSKPGLNATIKLG